MTFASWVLIGLIGGWLAHNAAEYSKGLLSELLLGVLSASLGGYVLSHLLGIRLDSGLAFVPTASCRCERRRRALAISALQSWPSPRVNLTSGEDLVPTLHFSRWRRSTCRVSQCAAGA